MNDNILEIRDLVVEFNTEDGCVHAINGLNLSIGREKTLGLVGETGAGKTTTALSVLNLVPDPPGKICSGSITLDGRSVLDMSDDELEGMRGNDVAMIFQDPMTALNPIMKVGEQISEVIYEHDGCSLEEAYRKSLQMLEMVGIRPERAGEYPHQFSGGMKQRVVIAIALACNPQLLIADEPTTALDVTIQAQVLAMMKDLKTRLNTAMLLITHDLGIVAQTCDRVAIMYAGEIVEYGTLEHIFRNAVHPYTIGLFGSLPSLERSVRRLTPIPGLMPDPTDLPSGCSFHPRCPRACDRCTQAAPPYTEIESGHFVRCIFAAEGGSANG